VRLVTLREAIIDYTEDRSDVFLDHIDEFIRSAEAEIWLAIEAPQSQFELTGSLSITDTTLIVQSNPIETSVGTALNISQFMVKNPTSLEWEPVLIRDLSFLKQAYPDDTVQGIPRYYAYRPTLWDETRPYDDLILELAPAASGTIDYQILYYGYPLSITLTGQTAPEPWLSRVCPDALVYGAAKHGYIFMKGEPDMISAAKGEFQRALVQVKSLSEGRVYSDQFHDGMSRAG
jgi:hypothetical protein